MCFSFLLCSFVATTGLELFQEGAKGESILFISEWNHGKSWHKVKIDVPAGQYFLYFNDTYNMDKIIDGGKYPGDTFTTAINNITFEPGKCSQKGRFIKKYR